MLLGLTHSLCHLVLRQCHRLLQGHLNRRARVDIKVTRTGEQGDRGNHAPDCTDGRSDGGVFALAARDWHARAETPKL
jgi:hypothetical protein